ncbi:hypothetical protein [Caldicellulosiruptor acetigenus]|uniref:hypothetical protein n=1 Tax=Caldicellulosiruptor acetigenus TaxID=301953 RepID=UPI0004083C2A|nr:hypothetical protein [Caldicellulosiruptor acetigenus]WAM36930.1 hypothetical protein OTK01_000736 [Caldicellulosiruptor acetigenus]
MGYINFNLKETLKIIVRTSQVPEVVKGIYVNKRNITVVVKPAAILPEVKLNFTVKAEDKKIQVIFNESQSTIVYGFLKMGSGLEKTKGVYLLKDRIVVDLEEYISESVKGMKFSKLDIDEEGNIEIEFGIE